MSTTNLCSTTYLITTIILSVLISTFLAFLLAHMYHHIIAHLVGRRLAIARAELAARKEELKQINGDINRLRMEHALGARRSSVAGVKGNRPADHLVGYGNL